MVVLDGGQAPSGNDLLDIEDGVDGVHGGLVLGSLTDQSLGVSEGDERRGGEGTLFVGDDLDIAALVGGHTGVGGTCCDDEKLAIMTFHGRSLHGRAVG